MTFIPGQIWSYDTRANESTSRLTIVAVDDDPKHGLIVHISVEGLALRTPQVPNGISETVSHMPFSEDALKSCVVELLQSEAPLPDYRDGYDTWKDAFDRGEAGVFSISVADAIDAMESAINQ